MSDDSIRWEQTDGVAWITLNRPASLNSWNAELGKNLLARLSDASDPTVRAVVITGTGRAFSSGADLTDVPSPSDGAPPPSALEEIYHPIIVGVRELAKPVIAAVNGPAVGIGASLALACDFVAMARSAYVLLAFVNIGLMPDGGSTLLSARAVGKARAFEMAMLGERISSARALDWGLVNSVHDDEELLVEVGLLANRFASGPTRAYAASKQALNQIFFPELREQLKLELTLQRELVRTHDFGEGVAAFAAKRPAVFEGR